MALKKGADIQARTFDFACEVVALVDILGTRGLSATLLGKQLLSSGTSIGANLEEADAAHSRADFVAKCVIALREARETHYWLRVLSRTKKIRQTRRSSHLLAECNEIVAVLTTIVRKTKATA